MLRETGMRIGEILALNYADVTLAPEQEGLHPEKSARRTSLGAPIPGTTEMGAVVPLEPRHAGIVCSGSVPMGAAVCAGGVGRDRWAPALYHPPIAAYPRQRVGPPGATDGDYPAGARPSRYPFDPELCGPG